VEEAVTLRRELAALNRDTYLPALAGSLNNYANHLAQAGRHADALTAVEEAVTLRRELAALNRDTYLPDLAASLWMYAHVCQVSDTENAQAIASAREAESILAELAAVEPAAFHGRLRAVEDLLHKLGDGTKQQ